MNSIANQTPQHMRIRALLQDAVQDHLHVLENRIHIAVGVNLQLEQTKNERNLLMHIINSKLTEKPTPFLT